MEVDPACLDFVKPIIDGLRAVLPKDLHIPQIALMGTYLILAVVIRANESNIKEVQIDSIVREIIDCIKYAAEAIRANAQESKPKPLDKVAGLVTATKKLLRALKDGGRVKMQVDYVNDSVTIGLPMPDANDFTDVIESHTESRRLDQPVCGYFSAGENQDHMIVLRDRTFIRVPLELHEILEMARRKTTFAAVVSRKSAKDDWIVGDAYRVPGELFPTHA